MGNENETGAGAGEFRYIGNAELDALRAMTDDEVYSEFRAACLMGHACRRVSADAAGHATLWRSMPNFPRGGNGDCYPASETIESLEHVRIDCQRQGNVAGEYADAALAEMRRRGIGKPRQGNGN